MCEPLADTEVVSLHDALMIAIPAAALLIVLVAPGQPRWLRRPWFISGSPRRGLVGVLFAILLLAATFRAVV
jgi:hypothetical protein